MTLFFWRSSHHIKFLIVRNCFLPFFHPIPTSDTLVESHKQFLSLLGGYILHPPQRGLLLKLDMSRKNRGRLWKANWNNFSPRILVGLYWHKIGMLLTMNTSETGGSNSTQARRHSKSMAFKVVVCLWFIAVYPSLLPCASFWIQGF